MEMGIGIKVETVAVFDVSSVNIIMLIMLTIVTTIIDVFVKLSEIEPINPASPELFIAEPKVKPPPIKIKTPQGIFLATFQLINLFLSERKEGSIKSTIAAPIAIFESLIDPTGKVFSNKLLIHFLEIHNVAVIRNIMQTIISSGDIFPNSFCFFKINSESIFFILLVGKQIVVKTNHAIGRSIKVVGRPIINQSIKLIW